MKFNKKVSIFSHMIFYLNEISVRINSDTLKEHD